MRIIQINSAKDFVEYLRPSNDHWWNVKTGLSDYVFRGHADSNWGLIASGLRPLEKGNRLKPLHSAFLKLAREVGIEKPPDSDSGKLYNFNAIIWTHALAEATCRFIGLARQVGLETRWLLPNTLLKEETFTTNFTMPAPLPFEAVSLAQHHSVPTWLLDWSDDPLTAAYFSAGAEEDVTDMCVWALKTDKVNFQVAASTISLKWTPTFGNNYLRAQSGVLLGLDGPCEVFGFQELLTPLNEVPVFQAQLVKLVLKGSERMSLRQILLREKRSLAHLMPSWDSVAQTVIRQWHDE